jgi:choline dehydrogenase-like flavoprotein
MTTDTLRSADAPHYDALIIGSGAGGAAAAYQLTRAGLHVVLVEKGRELPRDGSTLDIAPVIHEGRFKSQEPWLDGAGQRFKPEEYFNLGGKTRWYGAALLRYGRHEFAPDLAHQCPGWPISYEDLAGYYDQAERLLGIRHFDLEPDLRAITERLIRRSPAWRQESIPLGLSAQILRKPIEASHFDGFASVAGLKADAETSFLTPVRNLPNLTLLTGSAVTELLPWGQDATRIRGARLADGRVVQARVVLLAAGALHSPRLLQHYIDQHGLTASLAATAPIGRNLKMHVLTAMVALSPGRKTDLIRKTNILFDRELAHSSVQPLGFDGELISTLIPRLVPRVAARQIGQRAYGFFLQTEDGAHPDNRVRVASAASQNLPQLDYDVRRTPAALQEHQRLVRSFRLALLRAGMLAFSQRIGVAGTAHVSGTLGAGKDAATSVVNAVGKVHGLSSLYVVDGSILPRSSRVNPSLTIYAWSLRVADLLAQSLGSTARAAPAHLT